MSGIYIQSIVGGCSVEEIFLKSAKKDTEVNKQTKKHKPCLKFANSMFGVGNCQKKATN